jgi:hypothetical protein
MDEISQAYANRTEATLAAWRDHPDPGDPLPPSPNRQLLGVTSGCLFRAQGELAALHDELVELAARDSRLDVVPTDGLHFTFLALAWNRYASVEALPRPLAAVIPIFQQVASGLDYRLHSLRLVPLPNALVLAGLPDARTNQARQAFAEEVLATAWAPLIRDRYRDYPTIPPLFWHTTLARYGTHFASPALRRLYFRHKDISFGDLSLGRPQLVAASYGWSQRYALA